MPDSFSRQNPSCALINLSFVRALNAAVMSGLMMLLIYRLSIKSFYNLKNILQRQLMRYLNQIFFSMYSVLIKIFNHIGFVYFRYPGNERGTVK